MAKFSSSPCAINLIKAAKGVIDDKEVKGLLDRIDQNQNDASVSEMVEKLSKDFVDQSGYKAFNEKRTAIFNVRAKRRMMADMATMQATPGVKGKYLTPDKVEEAYSVGSTDPGVGTRNSAATRRDSAQHSTGGKLFSALKREKLDRLVTSGKFDPALREASWEITATPEMKERYPLRELNKLDGQTQKEVRRAAELWHKTKQDMIAEAANQGVYIHELPGFSVSQLHDRQKIRQASGRARAVWDHSKAKDREAYINDLRNTLDFDKTAENFRRFGKMTATEALNPDKLMESLWEVFTTGVRKEGHGPGASLVGKSNIAMEAEKGRLLAFKDPGAEQAYDSKYGAGSFWQAQLNQIRDMANTTTTARFFGPSAADNWAQVLESRHIMEREKLTGLRDGMEGNPAKQKAYERQLAVVQKLQDSSRAGKYFDAYMGTDRDPGNVTQAAVVDTLMGWNRLRSLGGSLFASLVNDPYTTVLQNYYAGVPLLRSTFAPIISIIQRAGKSDIADVLRRTGVGLDGTFGTIASRLDGNGAAPGDIMRKMENTFFKATGLSGFTDMNKAGYVFTISNEMAEHAGMDHSQLPPRMQNHLADYQIGPKEWDIIRKSGLGEYNGYKMLNSDGVLSASEELFGGGSKAAINDERYDIAAKLTNLFRDSADYASVTPDLKTQQFLKFGAKGTITGDAARLTLQFQTFNAAMVQKFVLRHYRSQSFPQFLFGTMGGLTIAGTFGWYINELRRGFDPMQNPDLWQDNDRGKATAAWGKTLLAGLNYSGAGGMAGDWLFNQSYLGGHSSGGGVTQLGGPTTDAIVNAGDQIGSIAQGKFNGASAVRYGASLVPGSNIWWARPMLNYGLLYGLQENMNPGTLHRIEETAKQNGTPFWAPPSQLSVGAP